MQTTFARKRLSRGREAGFTLLELMIVISIIFILIGMAVGQYGKTVQHAREAALHTDLQTMREAIDNYTLDRLTPPQSLEDLKNAGYLREVPTDPITQAKDWQLDYGTDVLTPDQNGSGITDVHSVSAQISKFEGTPYSSW
jgi:general secretion pathway protein G